MVVTERQTVLKGCPETAPSWQAVRQTELPIQLDGYARATSVATSLGPANFLVQRFYAQSCGPLIRRSCVGAGGVLPTAFLNAIGVNVETKYGTA